jgi:hypothetical protein
MRLHKEVMQCRVKYESESLMRTLTDFVQLN